MVVAQLFKKFSTFSGTRRFITVFTRAPPPQLSPATSSHPVPLYSQVLQVVSSCFPATLVYEFLTFPLRSVSFVLLILLDLFTLMLFT
jgi:hypothetical protein